MLRILFLIMFISLLSGFSYSQKKQTIFFEWHEDSLNGELFPKTSMHIPVQFDGDSASYYYQFDTGADRSYLYTGGEIDSTFCERLTNQDGVETNIGRINFLNKSSNKVYEKDGKLHIGTIGSDFISEKKIEIDFVKQTITFLERYDSTKYNLSSINTGFGRPILQLEVNGKEYDFLFDTGSSLFELWTIKRFWRKWGDSKESIDKFPISSWGKINTAYRTKFLEQVTLTFCSEIILREVWYNSSKNFKKLFKEIGVHGIIGNKPFLDNIVLIDVENNRFGIKACM